MLKKHINKKNRESSNQRPLHILLIEDSNVDAYMFKAVLRQYMPYPCEVSHVLNMAHAKSVLTNNKNIDVILLDLGLPDTKNGVDSFQRVISAKESGIPVVVLTGEDDHNLAMKLVDSGAEDYIKKSIVSQNPKRLCDVIDFSICRHKHLNDFQKKKANELEEKDQVIQWMSGSYSVL